MRVQRLTILLYGGLLILWALILRLEGPHYQGTTIILEAELPYGATLAILQTYLNQYLSQKNNPIEQQLRSFFEEIGQYHFVQVRCPNSSLCYITAQRSSVVTGFNQDALLVETPLRLAKNPYHYQPNFTVHTALPLDKSLAALCTSFQKYQGRADIFADRTVVVTLDDIDVTLFFWPLETALKSWESAQKSLPVPLKDCASCDMRYPHGMSYQLKKLSR